jgi:hypothetical protein
VSTLPTHPQPNGLVDTPSRPRVPGRRQSKILPPTETQLNPPSPFDKLPSFSIDDPIANAFFETTITDSLDAVGIVEHELARRIAGILWRLRQAERTCAARSRLRAAGVTPGPDTLAEKTRGLGYLRESLPRFDRDPADEPPLVVRLPGLADSDPITCDDVSTAYSVWVETLEWGQVRSFEKMVASARIPESATEEPDSHQWTAGQFRRLAKQFARVSKIDEVEYLRWAVAAWREGLPEARIQLAKRRAATLVAIEQVEMQLVDLGILQANPDVPEADVMARQERIDAETLAMLMETLLAMQAARRSNKSAHSNRSGRTIAPNQG